MIKELYKTDGIKKNKIKKKTSEEENSSFKGPNGKEKHSSGLNDL